MDENTGLPLEQFSIFSENLHKAVSGITAQF